MSVIKKKLTPKLSAQSDLNRMTRTESMTFLGEHFK